MDPGAEAGHIVVGHCDSDCCPLDPDPPRQLLKKKFITISLIVYYYYLMEKYCDLNDLM